MSPRKQVALLRFDGPRFQDHGLDVDVLPEIMTYKRLLQETAKELWRRKHPKRIRLPKNFDAELTLKFFELEAGSTGVPLVRDLILTDQLQLIPYEDELDEAAVLLEDTIRAAGERLRVTNLPRSIIPLFEELGRTLRGDETLLVSAGKRETAARYDQAVKEWILGWAEPSYTDSVDLIGEVRATDLDGLKFTMRVQGGRKITGRFKPEQETLVLEALGEHFSRRMRVTGVGQFAREDGTLKQVIDVEQIELIEPHEAVPEQTVPIWDQLASVGTGVPQDAWKDVPADFSTNVDSYLYGGRKDRL